MSKRAADGAAPAPGRYIPANAGAVSRILKKAGLRRQDRYSSLGGYRVRGRDVTISVRRSDPCPTESLDEMTSVATLALTAAGYLAITASTNGHSYRHIDVYQPVRADAHTQEFLSHPYSCKVVTQKGVIIDAIDDPKVKAEVAALNRSRKEQEEAAERSKEAVRARQSAVMKHLTTLGVASGPAPFDPTRIVVRVEDLERLFGLSEAKQ